MLRVLVIKIWILNYHKLKQVKSIVYQPNQKKSCTYIAFKWQIFTEMFALVVS